MKVLITGGSRGIGKAIASELARSNHEILIVSKNKEHLANATKDLAQLTAEMVKSFACNVSNESEIQKLYDFCVKENFLPNVLVLNAGVFIEGSLTSSKSEDFIQTMEVNLYHIYYCVKTFIRDLKNTDYPRIIIIGSTASLEPYPMGSLYGVAKWGLRGYAINLRKELMNEGVGVTLINPGGTWTDLWAGEQLPKDRLLEASDIGKIVVNILSLSRQAVVEEIIIRPMLGDIHE